MENSPHPGLSRTSSLRDRRGQTYRRIVTFNPSITRQSSLPNGGTATSSITSDDIDLQRVDSWASHIDVQGETVQLRRKPIQSLPPLDGSSISSTKKNLDPNIDFELDVKVLIKSGKCVLHTKDPVRDEEAKMYL